MLTIYDDQGAVRLDASQKVFKFLGSVSVGGVGTPQTGFVDNPMFAQGKPYPFIFVNDGSYSPVGNDVVVDFSGTRMTWTYPSADGSHIYQRSPTTIVYGVY